MPFYCYFVCIHCDCLNAKRKSMWSRIVFCAMHRGNWTFKLRSWSVNFRKKGSSFTTNMFSVHTGIDISDMWSRSFVSILIFIILSVDFHDGVSHKSWISENIETIRSPEKKTSNDGCILLKSALIQSQPFDFESNDHMSLIFTWSLFFHRSFFRIVEKGRTGFSWQFCISKYLRKCVRMHVFVYFWEDAFSVEKKSVCAKNIFGHFDAEHTKAHCIRFWTAAALVLFA